jgi:hypothetical protein
VVVALGLGARHDAALMLTALDWQVAFAGVAVDVVILAVVVFVR